MFKDMVVDEVIKVDAPHASGEGTLLLEGVELRGARLRRGEWCFQKLGGDARHGLRTAELADRMACYTRRSVRVDRERLKEL